MEAEVIQENQPVSSNTINDTCNKGIPLQRLIELRSKGLSYKEIGDIVDCSKVNVFHRLADYKDDIESLKSFKENRADLFAVYQSALLNSITLSDIKDMSVHNRIVDASILYDKERLERDKSTDNVSFNGMVESRISMEEASAAAQDRKQVLMDKIAVLEAQDATTGKE